MNQYFFLILLLAIFFILGCSENSTGPEFENGYVQRDYIYDKNILLDAGVDTNDFKSKYTIEEMNDIIFNDPDPNSNHHGVIVADEIFYINIYDIVNGSYDIINGIVKSSNPEWDNDHRFIETVTILDVSKSYKNKVLLDQIILRDKGGTLDGYGTVVTYDPLPKFQVDERVLVFVQPHYGPLGESENGEYSTYNRQQGKFSVVIIEN